MKTSRSRSPLGRPTSNGHIPAIRWERERTRHCRKKNCATSCRVGANRRKGRSMRIRGIASIAWLLVAMLVVGVVHITSAHGDAKEDVEIVWNWGGAGAAARGSR